MPIDPLPFPKTREDLGIASDAVVYTLVARGIPEKGWEASIAAFVRLREKHPERALHLLLCGEGEEPDRLFAIHGTDPDITFLGFQSRIHGLYRLSDVAIVPSRFSGESFPLCIIQAFQSGTPVVGTRVGEIATMLAPPDQMPAGVLIDPSPDDGLFVRALEGAMEIMLSEASRNEYAEAARTLGEGYSMDKLVSVYHRLYERLLAEIQDDAQSECTTAA
jgi:glycosyltransferase involved in cell wall biosynthesis